MPVGPERPGEELMVGTCPTRGGTEAHPYRVFISDSHTDRRTVHCLVHVLSNAGVLPASFVSVFPRRPISRRDTSDSSLRPMQE